MSIGLGVSENIDKYRYYIKNLTLTSTPFELEVLLQKSRKENRDCYVYQSSSKLNAYYNFVQRSFAFRDYLPYDNINWLKFQLSNKRIDNQMKPINNEENSNHILTDYVSNDKQLKAKIGFKYDKQNEINFNWMNIKVTTSLVSSLHSLYSHTHLFMRKTINLKPMLLQFNCEGKKSFSLNKNELKLHEKVMVNQYRGLKYKEGGLQGLNQYLLLCSKLYLQSFPNIHEFNLENDDFMVNPFTHLNVLLTTHNNPIRISAGIGASIITKMFSFEVLYTPYIKKASTDIHSLFQIKFGID